MKNFIKINLSQTRGTIGRKISTKINVSQNNSLQFPLWMEEGEKKTKRTGKRKRNCPFQVGLWSCVAWLGSVPKYQKYLQINLENFLVLHVIWMVLVTNFENTLYPNSARVLCQKTCQRYCDGRVSCHRPMEDSWCSMHKSISRALPPKHQAGSQEDFLSWLTRWVMRCTLTLMQPKEFQSFWASLAS